jgi:hypothetical protein
MPEAQVRILQISDLHLNHKVDKNISDILCHIARTQKPQVVIASGDLANQPLPWQMKRAAEFLQRLQQAAQPDQVLVVAGNHDYKYWGNFGLRRASRMLFHVYFRRDGLGMSRLRRWGHYLLLFLNSLWPWGKLMKDPIDLHGSRTLGWFLLALVPIRSERDLHSPPARSTSLTWASLLVGLPSCRMHLDTT